tara:strand:+ start:295 stop:834 length:540 start_codon:yes stop_codon:yes gene_type:complete
MAKLTEEQKAFLVCGFARWATRADLMRAFEEEFGIQPLRSQLENYNLDGWRATRHTEGRKDPMKKWRPLWNETREKFKKDTIAIPIANAAVRLSMLNDMANQAYAKKNFKLAAELIEQAAKEAGGAFTNVREVKGKVEHEHDHHVLTPEEKQAKLMRSLTDAIATAVADREAAEQPTIQ